MTPAMTPFGSRTHRRRPPRIRIAGVRVRRRTVALFAAVALTFGGMALTYIVPAVLAWDIRLVTAEGITSGLLVGLAFAFLGVSAVTAFSGPRRRVSPVMISIPAPNGAPVVQSVRGIGRSSAEPNASDDLMVTFIYYRSSPYSVWMDISAVDPYTGAVSDAARWEVSRDVLFDAVMLGQPGGLGDFSVSALSSGLIQMRLMESNDRSHRGEHYDMRLPRRKVNTFLLRTTRVVPVGLESSHLDIDGSLERLFA